MEKVEQMQKLYHRGQPLLDKDTLHQQNKFYLLRSQLSLLEEEEEGQKEEWSAFSDIDGEPIRTNYKAAPKPQGVQELEGKKGRSGKFMGKLP